MKVFISSTMQDLAAERAAVAAMLGEFHVLDVVRAETFAAQADASQSACISAAQSADLVVLLLGSRYGFVPETANPDGLSVTHLEYRAARAHNVPVLAFSRRGASRDEHAQRFLHEVEHYSTGVFRLEWDTTQQLCDGVLRSVREWLVRRCRRDINESTPDHAFVEQLRSRLPITCHISAAGSAPSDVMDAWLSDVVRDAQRALAAHRLPALLDGRLTVTAECRFVRMVYSEDAEANAWNLRIHLDSPLTVVEQHPPIDLTVQVTEAGDARLTQLLYLLVLLESGAIRTAIEEGSAFARATDDPQLTSGIFMNLAVATATASISLVPELARAALTVELGAEATNIVVAAILAYIGSLRQRHAEEAARIAEGWSIELLTRALRRGSGEADTLYTLTKQLAQLSGEVSLFGELIAAHPDYDARWYVHRDIGVVLFRRRLFAAATDEYEHAARLRKTDAELFRWAGDAAYYDGNWARALPLFRKAVELDRSELYYLADKVLFATSRVQQGELTVARRARRESVSESLTAVAVRCLWLPEWIRRWMLARAIHSWPLNATATRWLAMLHNRRGRYAEAAEALRLELAAVPENPQARLNLALNLLTLTDNTLSEEAAKLIEVAAFHGGPETVHHFATSLVNSPRQNALLAEADSLLKIATQAREARELRRVAFRGPERFGDTTHLEL